MNDLLIIGVDPGLTGGICVLPVNTTILEIDFEHACVFDAFLLEGKGVSRVDINSTIQALVRIVRKAKKNKQKVVLAIEDVHAIAKASPRSSFIFGFVLSVWLVLAKVFKLELLYCLPRVWKAHFGLIHQDKDASIELAKNLVGDPTYLNKKKHHNRAEAILIGVYAFSQLTGSLKYARFLKEV